MSDAETPVVLYRAKDLIEAETIHAALVDAGLTARVEGEYLGTALGDIPLGATTAPRIVVRHGDLAAAKEILHEFLSHPPVEFEEPES